MSLARCGLLAALSFSAALSPVSASILLAPDGTGGLDLTILSGPGLAPIVDFDIRGPFFGINVFDTATASLLGTVYLIDGTVLGLPAPLPGNHILLGYNPSANEAGVFDLAITSDPFLFGSYMPLTASQSDPLTQAFAQATSGNNRLLISFSFVSVHDNQDGSFVSFWTASDVKSVSVGPVVPEPGTLAIGPALLALFWGVRRRWSAGRNLRL